MRLRKCRQCGTQYASSDARNYEHFCSDSCEQVWWSSMSNTATIVAALASTPWTMEQTIEDPQNCD